MSKVSIIVTAYLPESKPYLDACIQSIHNLNYPKELLETILVCPSWYTPEYKDVKRVTPCFGAYHNPIAVNFGMNEASKDSKYLFMINDDVILTKNSLKNLVEMAGDHELCLGAISNCDNFGHYSLAFPHNMINRQYRIQDINPHEIMNDESPYPPGYIHPQTLYLYANLFPRKVWEKVGGFDENFKTGYDDTDWCMRAQRLGVKLAIALNSLVWHCSGASADSTMGKLDSDVRVENEKYFRQKWGIA